MVMTGPRRPEPNDADDFDTTIDVGGRRVDLRRRGARLSLTVRGAPLHEDQARIIAMRHLSPGERLLDAVNDDPAASFTFVVWPRVVSHTGRLLDELRAA
ncbi:MAG: hypothetical protein DK306_000898 [Chloroflexi bacterium]|jgi:hypothetical protein|nr:MAG: hypothetical protein DK306_000898 [Chloroflexota bacterium]